MAAFNLKHLIGGNFVSIVEAGTEVIVDEDPVIVDINYFPNVASGAWGSLGPCFDGIIEPKFKDTPIMRARPRGGYVETLHRMNTGNILKFNFEQMCEPIDRLVLQVLDKIQNNVAQSPLLAMDPSIECWLNFQLRDLAGTDRYTMALYGLLRLDTNPKWSSDLTFPALQFEVIESPIASVLPKGIAA